MVRLVIKLLIVGLILHAAYRIGPPVWAYVQFRDAVQEAATYATTPSFSGRRLTPEQVLDKVAQLAQQHEVPLEREDFQLKMDRQATTIDARYTLRLEYLPRQYYPYEFIIHAEGTPSKYRSTTQ
jgi:hypothetical protein